MTRNICFTAMASLALLTLATPLLAARSPSPANIVKARQAGLKQLGGAFKTVVDGMRGTPNARQTMQAALKIKQSSQAMYRWFPAGSGPQPGIRAAAKPEIWAQPAEFRAAQDNFVRAASAFQTAAASGNADAIRAAFRPLGGACKGCHDKFRVPDEQ